MRLGIVHTGSSACRCHVTIRAAARVLGHEPVVAACERIDAARQRLAACDVVFEHADTFRGVHERRPELRFLLESWGCRLAGASAAAAALADDKIAAHRAMERAGVPMPRWRAWRGAASPGLAYPVVVKRPLAHGSAGLRFVRGEAEWRREKGGLRRPSLVEEFVEGRELALAGYEAGGRIRWLPVVEVAVPAGAVYSHRLKWGVRNPGKRPMELPGGRRRELEALAARAWRALRLRDYARFDVRLRADGEFRFLEANVRPSVEPGSEMMVAARLAGLKPEELIGRILGAAARRNRVNLA